MEIVLLLVGLIAGVAIGFLYGKSKGSNSDSEVQLKVNEQSIEIGKLESVIQEKNNALSKESEALKSLNASYREAEITLAGLQSDYKNLEKRFEDYKLEVKDIQTTFKDEFKNLSTEIIKKQTEEFASQNDVALKPFKEQLKSFEEAVHNQVKDNIEKAATFKEQIEQLKNLNLQISQEANNLTNALKGDNKLQGNWGELILERVLESSGLEKGTEYKTQVSLENVDDNRIQPDAVVYLPDNKHIIIDSKVSLVAYERHVNAQSEEERDSELKAHIQSLKNHIKGLSEKKYETAEGLTTPDFILLFVPIEASFGVAIKEDIDLFNYAWNKNIVIVSPSTLLATLKTVASLWKQEKQNRNVLKIAEESGRLYDKFVGFLIDLKEIEKSFEKTSKYFSEANKKLHTGKGNIVGKIERLKALGAKATKSIDEKYLED